MDFHDVIQLAVHAFEAAGVAIFTAGALAAALRAWRTFRQARGAVYERLRQDIGRSILLGLEVLIIADILQTIVLDPTLESALTLGIVVLVRTFLSFSLEVELHGVAPWRAAALRSGSRSTDTSTS